MKRFVGAVYTIGLFISAIIGVLHFFAPYVFQWYSYIPNAPREIYASIDYINFFFSLLLTGLSAILLFMKKKVLAGSRDILPFYVLLVLSWLSRVVITLVIPWPTSLQTWLLVGFGTEFVLTLLPMIYLLRSKSVR